MKKVLFFLLFSFFYIQTQPLRLGPQFNWKDHSVDKIYIRIFKFEREMEIWVSDVYGFRLYKKYKICKLSGGFGPKRREGDLQVPEGFYYINDFNPNSKYHLSLGINYPNESDMILTNHTNPGGLIYIHGDCVSVGCIAIGDKDIEEVYYFVKGSRERVNVHIFPINYRYFKSLAYFDSEIKSHPELLEFEKNVFEGYEYFEKNLTPPEVSVNKDGKYIFN
jgi:murein L,D-transpeptidase YafK